MTVTIDKAVSTPMRSFQVPLAHSLPFSSSRESPKSDGKPLLLKRGRFELWANGLSLFVVAFCVLKLSTRCIYLRSIFFLNMLALLHCCYIERLWDMEVIVALLLEISHQMISYPGCGLFYGNHYCMLQMKRSACLVFGRSWSFSPCTGKPVHVRLRPLLFAACYWCFCQDLVCTV
jgi:hypothetical protein